MYLICRRSSLFMIGHQPSINTLHVVLGPFNDSHDNLIQPELTSGNNNRMKGKHYLFKASKPP